MKSICGKECGRCVLFKDQCGGCSMCEACICDHKCRNCSALCPNRPEAVSYLNSLAPGFPVRANAWIELPDHIPIIPDLLNEPPKYEDMPVVAVHGGNMFSRNGEKVNNRYLEKGFAGALNIDKRSEAILQFYVKDRTLEGFWDNRNEIYKQLYQLNFKSIIAPNFSVYEDAPRMDHIFNIKRSAIVFNELIDYGFHAIPDISWYNKKDLDIWAEAITISNINIVAFSFQVVDVQLKASNIWKLYLLGFRYLCKKISPLVEIIVVGISSHRRLKEIFAAASGQKIHILNQSAFVQSRRGMLSQNRVREIQIPKDQLLTKNIVYFNNIYKELNMKTREEKQCQKLEEVIQ